MKNCRKCTAWDKGSLIDLNIENSRRIEAQSEEAQAKYNLVFQQIVLKYFIGVLY
jgi:hypothetical protein